MTREISGQRDLLAEVTAVFCTSNLSQRVLDIGTGQGLAARTFHEAGCEVAATGFNSEAYGTLLPDEIILHEDVDICDMSMFADEHFEFVWCAHVLEHVLDTGRALAEVRRILKPGGKLFLSVPPFKHAVVGGHVHTGWNVGHLMYVLAVAGFDLSQGRFVRHGYNIFGIAERGEGPLDGLRFANGDIEMLQESGRLPEGVDFKQGFAGSIERVNWTWTVPPIELPRPRSHLSSQSSVSPMRIGFFVPWITKSRGGTENVGQMMANAMAQRGHDIVIFTFDDDRSASCWPLNPSIRLVHLEEADDERADDQMALEVAAQDRELLVGLHMNRTFVRYVRCAHRLNLPVVLSEHIDPRYPDWIGTFSSDERAAAFHGATLIHLITEQYRHSLDESEQDRIRVIPNTVPVGSIEPRTVNSTETDKIIAIGRLVTRKNFDLVIMAFSTLVPEFPDWRLQIVGDGPERISLEKLSKKLNIGEKIEFIGKTDIPFSYIKKSEIMVIPSTIEGFPLVTLEAMAHGLPIVGYKICGGVNEQIIDGKTGILVDGWKDITSLANAIRSLMRDKVARREMGKAALIRYNNFYSQDIVENKWESLFLEAIEMGARKIVFNSKQNLSYLFKKFVEKDKTIISKKKIY